jgi:hypothetical protein
MFTLLLVLARTLRSLLISFFLGREYLSAENAALRLQVTALREKRRPTFTALGRFFLVLFARFDRDWRRWVFAVQPETILRRHRAGWRLFWKWKSRPGRPPITREHIAFIRRMSSDHPEWGENKIAEELAAIPVLGGLHHDHRLVA